MTGSLWQNSLSRMTDIKSRWCVVVRVKWNINGIYNSGSIRRQLWLLLISLLFSNPVMSFPSLQGYCFSKNYRLGACVGYRVSRTLVLPCVFLVLITVNQRNSHLSVITRNISLLKLLFYYQIYSSGQSVIIQGADNHNHHLVFRTQKHAAITRTSWDHTSGGPWLYLRPVTVKSRKVPNGGKLPYTHVIEESKKQL